MKVLFFHNPPYALMRGGTEVQIERMRQGLQHAGVAVGLLAWWDTQQSCDIIHHFGRPEMSFLSLAHGRGFKVVVTESLGGAGARPSWQLFGYKVGATVARAVGLTRVLDRMQWAGLAAYSDAVIAGTEGEAKIFRELFGVPPRRVHVVSNHVSDDELGRQLKQVYESLLKTAG